MVSATFKTLVREIVVLALRDTNFGHDEIEMTVIRVQDEVCGAEALCKTPTAPFAELPVAAAAPVAPGSPVPERIVVPHDAEAVASVPPPLPDFAEKTEEVVESGSIEEDVDKILAQPAQKGKKPRAAKVEPRVVEEAEAVDLVLAKTEVEFCMRFVSRSGRVCGAAAPKAVASEARCAKCSKLTSANPLDKRVAAKVGGKKPRAVRAKESTNIATPSSDSSDHSGVPNEPGLPALAPRATASRKHKHVDASEHSDLAEEKRAPRKEKETPKEKRGKESHDEKHRDRDEKHRDRDEKHRDRDEKHRDRDEKHRDRDEKHRDRDEKHARVDERVFESAAEHAATKASTPLVKTPTHDASATVSTPVAQPVAAEKPERESDADAFQDDVSTYSDVDTPQKAAKLREKIAKCKLTRIQKFPKYFFTEVGEDGWIFVLRLTKDKHQIEMAGKTKSVEDALKNAGDDMRKFDFGLDIPEGDESMLEVLCPNGICHCRVRNEKKAVWFGLPDEMERV